MNKVLYKYILTILSAFGVSYLLNVFIFQKDSSIPHLSTFALILSIFLLIKRKNKILVSSGGMLLFFLIIQINYSLVFGERVSVSVLDSFVETNKKESLSMAGHLSFILILPSLVATIVLFHLIRKKSKNIQYHITFKSLPVFLFFVTFYLSASVVDKKLISDFREDDKTVGRFIRDRYPAVIGDFAYLYISSNSNDKYANTNEINEFNKSIIGKRKPDINAVILIVGESSLSTHYSAYGYKLDTTPNMSHIFSSNEGCIINNAHSSAPITRNSVSMSLAFHIPESEENLFKNKSIVEIAKSNGYKTYWLGSQDLDGLHSSKYGFIAKKSDVIKLTNFKDDNLSSLLNEVILDNSDSKFIVIHLHGSHMPYNNYDNADKIALPNADNYDLTIHHTDRVIKNIYDVINKKNINYSLIYTSDHGEIVNKGHGYQKGREQYLIPLMYKSNNHQYNCQFIESFRNKDGYLSGLMNKYILSTLIGYDIDPSILDKERNNDRVLTADESVLPFSQIE
ncbi:sulfatase-like hydrolase/transferase [Xenorhabdus griffiniae]|uniref:sulfatase-like hydrolase/transferase n=1 Tax=Xenorhabdus griffiniae TaxID=351672 RepID=UPI002359B611|nr:sulfatase-like hydrolase/transferase [Xenorhabdus griffiniae]MDC9604180.1 sulfatase-like hydrolase/transferase [Xenorhabdus griffiniae]